MDKNTYGRKLIHKTMLADKQNDHSQKRWKEALKRLGITALTLPLVALIGVTLLFLLALVVWAQRTAAGAFASEMKARRSET